MIGVLFESNEWSDHHLVDELRRAGARVHAIDECGNCYHVCPAGAVRDKGGLA